MLEELGEWVFSAFREAFVNSFQNVVRRGVHQALDLGEGCDLGAEVSIAAMSVERAEKNHWLSWLGEGGEGGGGMSQFSSLFVTPGQSASCQRGLGLLLWGVGGRRVIRMAA